MSTLSSVVSKLVRASHGSAIPDSVPDEDLDRVVAELILKEAREKELTYGKEGIGAYLPNGGQGESNLPKTNKRFLTTMLRNVDDHNTSVIRQQQLAADLAREERDKAEVWERIRQDEDRHERLDEERRESRKKEADGAKDRMRRLLGNSLRREGEGSSGRSKHRERGSGESPRSNNDDRRSSKTSHSRYRNGDHRKRTRHDEHDFSPRPHKRRRDDREYSSSPPSQKCGERISSSPPHKSHSQRHRYDDVSPPRRRRPELASDEDEDVWRPSRRRSVSRERRKHEPRLESDSSAKSTLPLHPALLDLDSTPVPSSPPMSKMDRYFDDAYDPRLDFQISQDGFVESGQFEGWDQMLEVLKLRKEEKRLREWEQAAREYEEDKRGRKKKSKEERELEERGRPIKELLEETKRKLRELEGKEKGIMDVVYKKRGEAREWDKGRVTF
ncbi:hypothetical protein DACRYDRAFT_115712 [Dacryopinax primogenitus]|uniref:Uncharacterized protein n=1 Tax=Dacryopinax primogenitus (strain DJM 731) TaxID=1858805 RepID=M5FXH7_DACPD|nr:uncharacterized protein DACRYDRAFT_115712 [Dacryopinax primogenitus]EJU02701.1 hypothetical protein DACRYDRAFT_115712 [Dacryopinax primogenitus]